MTENIKPSYYGSLYYGSGFYSGWDTNYERPDFPLLSGYGYNIIFYDRGGAKIGIISSDIKNTVLLNGSFELLTSGCGSFSLELSSLPAALSSVTYNYRVDIHFYNDQNPWFSGYILETSQPGTTEETYKLSGYGFFNQLEDVLINESYSNEYVHDIVKDVMTTYVENNTDIVYRASKIEDTTYQIKSVSWERVSAKEVFKQLAEYALGYEFGVDADREFFFREVSTEIQDEAHLFVGKHLNKFVPQVDISGIKNKLYIYGGEVSGTPPSNYLTYVEDTASQSAYGLKEGKLTMPSALDVDDAEQWGNYQLAELKDPVVKATIDGIDIYQEKIEAVGNARITSVDGLNEYTLPIERVVYNFSASGIEVKAELGELDTTFTYEQLKIKQKVIEQEQLNDQRTAQT
jgi:hypothetical protein